MQYAILIFALIHLPFLEKTQLLCSGRHWFSNGRRSGFGFGCGHRKHVQLLSRNYAGGRGFRHLAGVLCGLVKLMGFRDRSLRLGGSGTILSQLFQDLGNILEVLHDGAAVLLPVQSRCRMHDWVDEPAFFLPHLAPCPGDAFSGEEPAQGEPAKGDD